MEENNYIIIVTRFDGALMVIPAKCTEEQLAKSIKTIMEDIDVVQATVGKIISVIKKELVEDEPES